MTCSFVFGFLDVPFAMNTSKPFRLLPYSFIPAHSSLGAKRFVNLFWAMRVEKGFVTPARLPKWRHYSARAQPFRQSPVSKCNLAECFDYPPLIGRHDSRKNATHDSIWKLRTRAGDQQVSDCCENHYSVAKFLDIRSGTNNFLYVCLKYGWISMWDQFWRFISFEV